MVQDVKILDAMANAVQNAAIVLILFSKSYQHSANTRAGMYMSDFYILKNYLLFIYITCTNVSVSVMELGTYEQIG
ncbi:uncharacterized protein DC041_0011409 [Schistosoma bovis]|uniref:TIR domain-containing protein n=2 Tax=Schistosoma TaxID=6181 RepID=A0A430QTU9_SCHBO|nr:uncharacterized protein DC041_0011409 [Schistosoma bovis]VDP58638.1 unnamed protein product [Schistosoma mattheei]